eukprot:TRINITY_DN2344_c0_g1_i1.p2 TRINITY_DN2344_c0_g1~~TRINITY_DN2344_c0_g1_i1.p2  ORF type:complete len:481 (+),score=107.08 TRINITY_DN2344_c0_g1_i1:2115-3557(+)
MPHRECTPRAAIEYNTPTCGIMADEGAYPEQQLPFATVMFNAAQTLRCTLPTTLGETMTVTGAVSEDLLAELEECGMRLHCILMSPNLVPQDNKQWKGSIRIDDGHDTTLGCLYTRRQTETACNYAGDHPTRLTFTVECIQIDPSIRATTAAEHALVDVVKSILEDDTINPRHGALPLCVVETKAQSFDAYHAVVGPVEPTWEGFVRRQNSVFSVFRYSAQEIRDRGMAEIDNIGDLRILLRQGERMQPQATSGDSADGDAEVEARLKAYLQELLEDGDMESNEVLRRVAGVPEFLFHLAPSFSLLMRFLNRHRDLFSWTTDPGQPTKVSLANDSNRKPLTRPSKKRAKKSSRRRHSNDAVPLLSRVAAHPACLDDDFDDAVIRPVGGSASRNTAPLDQRPQMHGDAGYGYGYEDACPAYPQPHAAGVGSCGGCNCSCGSVPQQQHQDHVLPFSYDSLHGYDGMPPDWGFRYGCEAVSVY